MKRPWLLALLLAIPIYAFGHAILTGWYFGNCDGTTSQCHVQHVLGIRMSRDPSSDEVQERETQAQARKEEREAEAQARIQRQAREGSELEEAEAREREQTDRQSTVEQHKLEAQQRRENRETDEQQKRDEAAAGG